ncbi:hypothetical protein CLAFUW4_14771 [Fulvia fulva]|uniref:Uncharacterized protein n=1 Tax=Passalora fulva TaxID=5499 RepID=A0A9Q8PM93_PASFU|nr:uncharacterized protein CLAFUR5_14599 [Fulvia fulva]KAK4608938.1 hypothetical protein CLAFUR4_14763 [Fulvia fulva]KAK4609801.1 hypothetical protein CLAFUR0_14763 [Fulvia fulva]UJO25140.1 hypothetical protein CLAFUR5_14599 [Fulvia fulva]WPV22445.1 hypothetical protein CLAFUW4_14771 [Fulvia fulva]WPV37361.1 hypothetical protein CLAFUW7_14772 [Fulvia fulva]
MPTAASTCSPDADVAESQLPGPSSLEDEEKAQDREHERLHVWQQVLELGPCVDISDSHGLDSVSLHGGGVAATNLERDDRLSFDPEA